MLRESLCKSHFEHESCEESEPTLAAFESLMYVKARQGCKGFDETGLLYFYIYFKTHPAATPSTDSALSLTDWLKVTFDFRADISGLPDVTAVEK